MQPTRGAGSLEIFLTKRRISKVMKVIKPALFGGSVLDIGCGTYPYFLLKSPFTQKVGLDQVVGKWDEKRMPLPPNLTLRQITLSGEIELPFPDSSFDCVTSMACLEHLEPNCLPLLASEVYRVLKPSGQTVWTTPHAIADGPLQLLARMGWVSNEEIDEHKSLFHRRHLFELMKDGGFLPAKIKVRGFQFGLNILAFAEK